MEPRLIGESRSKTGETGTALAEQAPTEVGQSHQRGRWASKQSRGMGATSGRRSRKASQATGIDFDYLLGQAQLESGLNPTARAGTSSATGLYQFIDQSWLGVVKQHGSQYGLGWASDAITRIGQSLGDRQRPGDEERDPGPAQQSRVSASMAAEFASDNKASLEGSLGRGATGTDLYMAHFLGLGGARSFLKTMQANPGVSGAAMFPAAARANRNDLLRRRRQRPQPQRYLQPLRRQARQGRGEGRRGRARVGHARRRRRADAGGLPQAAAISKPPRPISPRSPA